MTKQTKIKKLQVENEKIREELDNLLGIDHPLYSHIWDEIHKLIENEIEQEEYSNQ